MLAFNFILLFLKNTKRKIMLYAARDYRDGDMDIWSLTLNLLTTTIVAPPSNASKWQMGFNLAFKWLRDVG